MTGTFVGELARLWLLAIGIGGIGLAVTGPWLARSYAERLQRTQPDVPPRTAYWKGVWWYELWAGLFLLFGIYAVAPNSLVGQLGVVVIMLVFLRAFVVELRRRPHVEEHEVEHNENTG